MQEAGQFTVRTLGTTDPYTQSLGPGPVFSPSCSRASPSQLWASSLHRGDSHSFSLWLLGVQDGQDKRAEVQVCQRRTQHHSRSCGPQEESGLPNSISPSMLSLPPGTRVFGEALEVCWGSSRCRAMLLSEFLSGTWRFAVWPWASHISLMPAFPLVAYGESIHPCHHWTHM